HRVISSNLNPNNLANDQHADHHQHAGQLHHVYPDRLCPQHTHEYRIDEIQHDTEDHRKKREDPAREPSLSGMHIDLALKLEVLADQHGCFFEDLGQVAAGLLLNHNLVRNQ